MVVTTEPCAAPAGATPDRQLLETAARAEGLGLCTLQKHGHRWRVHWNAQMHALHAWPAGRQPPRSLADWLRHGVHRDDRHRVLAQLRHWLRRADPPLTLDFRTLRAATATPRWLRLHAEATGEHGLMAVVREQSGPAPDPPGRLQMLARISHDLRTPLQAILGVTQLMLMSEAAPPDPARRRHQLEQVQGASRQLLALIEGAFDRNSREPGQLGGQAVDLPAVLAQAVGLLQQPAAAQGVRIRMGAQTQVPPTGDATRLRQLVVALLSNGIRHNRRGGVVTLASRVVQADDTPPGRPAEVHVVLSVSDDGPGLTLQQQARWFPPPHPLGADSATTATGTGLAIAQALADSMGGWLQVHSHPGQGSVFEVWLQRALVPGPQAAVLATPAPPGLPPSASGHRRDLPALARDGRGRVLYVEDNPVNAMIVQASVAHRPGIQLQVAEDGASGIRLAQTWQPHLVLLDMQLPDTDGHGVLKALRADARTAHLPCIALSANTLSEDIRQALAAGFIDYWTKPIELPALLGGLDALFGPPGES